MQFDPCIIGAIKIKDGLFIGDEFASKDLEFVVSNKVTHIINCAGKQVPNQFESFGVRYLTFPWNETDAQVLFDGRDQTVNEIYQFIEGAVQLGESCLVHSMRGQSRACCALAGFFMKKYKWKLYKTLEFLNSRRPDLEIRASFFHQLTQLEQRLLKTGQGAYSSSWDPALECDLALEGDENLLRNTFQNAKSAPPAEIWIDRAQFQLYLRERDRKDRKIQWLDECRVKGKVVSLVGGASIVKSTTPQNRKSTTPKTILRSINNQQTSQQKLKQVSQIPLEVKTQINQQLAASKIDNINGNIIHLTVNNYLTKKPQPQQQQALQVVPSDSKFNNFFEPPEQLPKRKDNNVFNPTEKEPILVPVTSSYRRTNDSLKKHIEVQEKKNYQSPYSYSIRQQPQQPPKRDNNTYQVKTIPVKSFAQNESLDRPNSANVPKADSSFSFQQKRPMTGNVNTRQFSPLVKGNAIPKSQMIVTQLNQNTKKTGLRYPSPGQARQDDLINNSIIFGKPSWK